VFCCGGARRKRDQTLSIFLQTLYNNLLETTKDPKSETQKRERGMSLVGKLVLVAGATGEVGRGAAYALSAAGAEVYLAGRNIEKLQAIQATLPNKSHVLPPADYSTVDGANELKNAVAAIDFDVVVASSGPWWPINKLSGVDPQMIEEAIKANFQSQVNLFSILGSKTKNYIVVNGSAALGLPFSGLTGVLANSVVGLAKLLDHECKDKNMPRFTHAMISASVGHPRDNTMDPKEFGKAFVAMALEKHQVDSTGTIVIDDDCFNKLAASL
jgi:NAD(P)-dependent dehydrogenase (short-subunit alcohol dehydrogenase family)